MRNQVSRRHDWFAVALSLVLPMLVLSLAGCGRSSSPPSASSTAETSATDQELSRPASGEAAVVDTNSSPSHPLATNEFDNRVMTTAGEVRTPAKTPSKTLPSVKSTSNVIQSVPVKTVAPLDEEAAEDLEAEMEDQAEGDVPEDVAGEPKEGTPEFKLREIAQLKAAPLNVVRQPVQGQPGKFENVQLTPAQSRAEQLRRWHSMVDLSIEVISLTKKNPEQEQLFNNAVFYLTETRKQLALSGEPDQAQLLVEDADALYKRSKTSYAAIESAHRVVQLTQIEAERSARQKPELAQAYAKQSRLFAEKFPQETNRTAMNLVTAGRMCEQLGLMDDAMLCYTTIQDRYPGTPFEDTTVGILRRLRLQGKKLDQFAGSTIDGGYISIDQYAGHPVLVIFWASNSQTFINDLPKIQDVINRHSPQGLMVVGVNLDRDQSAVDRFIDKHSLLAWNNIFFSDVSSRGVQNPIARHFGVTTVPTYWLIDPQGIVIAAPLDMTQMDDLLTKSPPKSVSNTK